MRHLIQAFLTHPPSECASGEHAQQAASENERAHFDMMSIAPNFDLLIEASTAEEVAKTIVRSDIGVRVTLDRSLIKTPGSTGNRKGTPDAVLKEVDIMLNPKDLANGWQNHSEKRSILQTLGVERAWNLGNMHAGMKIHWRSSCRELSLTWEPTLEHIAFCVSRHSWDIDRMIQ